MTLAGAGASALASVGLEWATTNDGSIPGSAGRTRANVEPILKSQVQGSSGWNIAWSSVIDGLLGFGLPLVTNIIYTIVNKFLGFVTFGLFNLDQLFDWIHNLPFIGDLIPGLDASKIISGEFAMEMVNGLVDFVGDVGDFISTIVGDIVGAVTGAINGTIATLTDWGNRIGSFIPNLLGGVWDALTSAVDFIGTILNPAGLLTSFVAGLIPGLDASKINSGTFSDGLLPGLLSLFNELWGGMLGIEFPGQQATSGQVGQAAAGQAQTLAALSAAVAMMQQQLEDGDPLTLNVEEDWEYSGPVDTAKWTVTTVGGSGGGLTVDGHTLRVVTTGFSPNQWNMRYIGADHLSTDDDMLVKVVQGAQATGGPWGPGTTASSVNLRARWHHTNDTCIELRVLRNSWTLYAVNSGVYTVMGSQGLASVPGAGSIITLECGTEDGPRYFRVQINNDQWDVFDSSSVSQYGSDYRDRGMGFVAGTAYDGPFLYQVKPGNVAHWASRNAA